MEFLQTGPEPENPNIEPEQATEQLPFSRRETALTMIGVLLIMFLVMLDQTIIGTATPRIVADSQGFYHIIWVTTAYLLTSTVPIPIYGKLSDLYGRKPLFLNRHRGVSGRLGTFRGRTVTECHAAKTWPGLLDTSLLPATWWDNWPCRDGVRLEFQLHPGISRCAIASTSQ